MASGRPITSALTLFAGVAALTVTGCGAGGTTDTAASTPAAPSTSPAPLPVIRAAAADCGLVRLVQDGGKSMSLDTGGTSGFGDPNRNSLDEVSCVLDSLNTPDYVREHISSTRALDGMQNDEWESVTARWTYHPDDGLQITIVQK